MYPKIYIDHFREFDRSDRIFVAMPFSKYFEPRWTNIFQPAIDNLGLDLKPWRGDSRQTSDSIHTDILRDISSARLIIADISEEMDGKRNANVMYEVGIAHAIRLPEEVILIRSDNGKLPFDFMQIRISHFDPDLPNESRVQVEDLIRDSLDEIDVTKDLLIDKTWLDLDPVCLLILSEMGDKPLFGIPLSGRLCYVDFAEVRVCMRRLQELGMVTPITDDHSGDQTRHKFQWTALGNAVKSKYVSHLRPFTRNTD